MPHSFRADPSGLTDTIRVFVSYTHDSAAHKHRVALLADRLRSDGIDCEIDGFEEAPPEGWPAWMARQLRQARFVLVVCTANYHRRATGREAPGIGLGARWEGGLITQHLYDTGGDNDKFIPVVFDRADLKEIPDFLRHTTYYDLSDTTQYEKLYRRLTAQPFAVRRPVGTRSRFVVRRSSLPSRRFGPRHILKPPSNSSDSWCRRMDNEFSQQRTSTR